MLKKVLIFTERSKNMNNPYPLFHTRLAYKTLQTTYINSKL